MVRTTKHNAHAGGTYIGGTLQYTLHNAVYGASSLLKFCSNY